jgi:uncharacterized protein YdeI (BOF family)
MGIAPMAASGRCPVGIPGRSGLAAAASVVIMAGSGQWCVTHDDFITIRRTGKPPQNGGQMRFGRLLTIASVALIAAAPAFAEDPYLKADDSWISISGTVKNVEADRFTLDYGSGWIAVEMDDGDRDADAYKLLEGDRVTVNGMIDDDLFETRTVEASSVYVEKLDTYFYASAFDEEDIFVTYWSPVVISRAVVQGTVTDVRDDEFTISTGTRTITVEVDEMAYDPLDDAGYQKVDVGDRVSVTGDMETDLFEGRELEATSLVVLG